MTLTDPPGSTLWVDLLLRQLAGLDAWHAERRARLAAAAAPGLSREERLDRDRAAEVAERVQEVVVERAGLHLLATAGRRSEAGAGPSVLVVARNAWFRDKVAADVVAGGARVLGVLESGADGLGAVVVEQPDLLLVEDVLPMLSGLELLELTRRVAPATRCVAHVESGGRVAAALDAGACLAFTRQVPPADVAAGLLDLASADSR